MSVVVSIQLKMQLVLVDHVNEVTIITCHVIAGLHAGGHVDEHGWALPQPTGDVQVCVCVCVLHCLPTYLLVYFIGSFLHTQLVLLHTVLGHCAVTSHCHSAKDQSLKLPTIMRRWGR